jgi:hypothetical protein
MAFYRCHRAALYSPGKLASPPTGLPIGFASPCRPCKVRLVC